jgi:hypothetical protein
MSKLSRAARQLAPRIVNGRAVASSFLLCAGVCVSLPTLATLGGTVDTVQGDGLSMHATRHVATHASYDVHELALGSGTLVREFVAPSGVVFGVAWQGPIKPDLNQLLGAQFPRMVAAAQSPHGDHRTLSVHAADLVIDSGGRMRSFAGRAYLPALVPAGVPVGHIR